MERRLSAIFAADMVGYSRLIEADERGTLERQKTYRQTLINPAFDRHHGRVVKEMGDGVLVEFPSVVEAVQCALDIQNTLPEREKAVPEDRRIAYRIGINLGDVVVDDDDIYGDGVNVAARLEQIAEPGGICISGTAHDTLNTLVEAGYQSLGEVHVKNISRPIRAYKVVLRSDDEDTTVPQPRPQRLLSRPRWRMLVGLGLLPLVLLAGGWGILQLLSLPQDNARTAGKLNDQKPSIAVLPFDDLSGDEDQVYFADGLAEDIITDLSKISGLFVIARNTSFQYRGKSKDLAKVSRDLGVRYVLEGSVRKSADKIRINAQLIDAKSGGHVWAERYDGSAADIFTLQDNVTSKILEALKPALTSSEKQALHTRKTLNPDAYDAYLRGLRLISERRRLDVDSNEAAQEAFEEAIRLDPDYADAYAGLGWAKWIYIESINIFDSSAREQAFTLARKSIEIRDNALAHRTLAREHFSLLNYWIFTTKKMDLAVEELEKARQLQPNNPDILADLSIALSFTGQPEKALKLTREAMERNTNHPDWYYAASGIAHLMSNDPQRALPDLRKWSASQVSYNVPYVFLAAALALSGKLDEANETLARFDKLSSTLSPANQAREGPFEIRTSTYAIKRKWSMAPEQEDIFLKGLRLAGMKDN